MNTNAVTVHTFSNGLRLVYLNVPGSPVAHFGVAVKAGSVDETSESQFGLAHFVEHTLFKGTKHRKAWHILNRMEAVGGELGAFTTKIDTVVYSTFPRSALNRAIELIFDLVSNAQFPAHQLDKERMVICDEINSYLDSPSDAVYDEFEDVLYNGSSLGHNILGTIDSVRSIDSEMCRAWLAKHYTVDNMVVFYAGGSSLKNVISRIDADSIKKGHKYQTHTANEYNERCNETTHFELTRSIDTHQAHTVLGCRLDLSDVKERAAMSLLTNLLGGPGMNSRLNVALREKRGLVYAVDSTLSHWRQSAMFSTYFGCDPEDNARCTRLIRDEIARTAETPMTARGLAAAKRQYLGSLIVARSNAESRILAAARSLLTHGTVNPLPVHAIAELTSSEVMKAAARLTSLSSLTLTR